MNETCDRCGPAVRAVYRVDRRGELYLCRHCTNQLRAALSAQGWAIWSACEHALAPKPANTPAPRDSHGLHRAI